MSPPCLLTGPLPDVIWFDLGLERPFGPFLVPWFLSRPFVFVNSMMTLENLGFFWTAFFEGRFAQCFQGFRDSAIFLPFPWPFQIFPFFSCLTYIDADIFSPDLLFFIFFIPARIAPFLTGTEKEGFGLGQYTGFLFSSPLPSALLSGVIWGLLGQYTGFPFLPFQPDP